MLSSETSLETTDIESVFGKVRCSLRETNNHHHHEGDPAYHFDDRVIASDRFETQAYATPILLGDPSPVLTIYNLYFHPADDGSPRCFNDRRPSGRPVGVWSTGFAMRVDLEIAGG